VTDTTDATGETDANIPAEPEDPTRTPALPDLAEAAVAETEVADLPEAQTLPDYMRLVYVRIRSGDSGVLPVVGGLILISVLFQTLNSNFLSAGNLVNLLIQGAVYMLLAMGEVFALLLGEIDLSIGFVSGIGGILTAELVKQSWGWPWWAAVIVALLACAAIGVLQGTIITRIGLPSFVVTLAGLLGWQGVMLLILGQGGSLPINDNVVNDFASGNLTPAASWIVMIVIVALLGASIWLQDARRRAD
jgi:D-xylose transport system permease protein